jgi:glycerol uptake facilitator protein
MGRRWLCFLFPLILTRTPDYVADGLHQQPHLYRKLPPTVSPSSLFCQTSYLSKHDKKGIVNACVSRHTTSLKTSAQEILANDEGLPINDRSALLPTLLRLRAGAQQSSFKRPPRSKLARELIAEAFGTFLIVNIGTGAVMSAIFADALVGLWQIAVVWVIAVTVAISATGSISGAHLNPAISICFALLRPSKSFGWIKVLPYILAQVCGSVLGSAANFFLYSGLIRDYEVTHGILRSSGGAIGSAKAFGEYFVAPITVTQAFFAEALGTALLAGVIFALTHPRNETTQRHGGLVPPLIGLTVGALVCVVAPLTQAGFNPARDFGPRIVAYLAGWKSVAFRGSWLYILAPMVGAPVGAAFVDRVLYGGAYNDDEMKS